LCHGAEAAAEAAETARRTFEEGNAGEGLPTITIDGGRLQSGLPLYEALKEAGLAQSNGEARRLIKGGGARVNDQPVQEELRNLTSEDLGSDGAIKLSAGKKRHALIRAE